MPNTIYTGLSQQIALQHRMEIVANNIANANTPGYRAQNMVFAEYVKNPDSSIETDNGNDTSLVSDYGQFLNTDQGPISQTENPLDFALEGDGYFGIVTQDGTKYTRGGSFRLNNLGELVNPSGLAVAGEGGGAITIPNDAKEIKVTRDGSIFTDQGQAGKLMVVEFDNQQDLRAVGNGLYETDSAGAPATETTVLQGALEGSNVQPIIEVTRMMDVMRAYQRTQNLLQTEHDRERGMIQRLTRAQ